MTVPCLRERKQLLPARHRQRGFTLLEMMVVLAILVLTATLFPLALAHASPGRRVRVGVQHLRAALLAAQTRSALAGQRIELTVPDLQHAASLASSTRLLLTSLDGTAVDTIAFFPDGSSSGARLTLADGGKESALKVSAVTGQVRIEAGAERSAGP